MDPRTLAQRAHGQMQANIQAMQDWSRELTAWEEVMAAKDEALRQRKLRRERGEEDPTDIREQGNIYHRQGDLKSALRCYTRSLTLDGCVEVSKTGQNSRLILPQIFFTIKIDFEDRSDMIVTTLYRKSKLAYSNRAMVHLKLKNFEAAVEDASLALALDPSHVKTLQRRAYAYIGQGMHHAALRDIDKALGYHPDNKELRVEKKRLEEKLKSLAPIEVLSSSSVSNDSGVGLTGN